MITVPAAAGTNSTALANGAELSVSVTTPSAGETFLVPAGSSSVDVAVAGSASIGQGAPDVHWTYVMDVSGSTAGWCGSTNIITCEKQAVTNLNNLVAVEGSAKDVAVAVFSSSGATADLSPDAGQQLLAEPSDPNVSSVINSVNIGGVAEFTSRNVGSGSTNFAAGLQAALNSVQASTAGAKNVVFLSDGASNAGTVGDFSTAVNALNAAGATIYSFAVGNGASCGAGSTGTLQQMANGTGGSCTAVPNPANLPDIITNVTATELKSVTLTVDSALNPFDSIATAPPFDGPGSANFTATAANQVPGQHEVCAAATGTGPKSDPASEQSVAECEVYYVFGFGLEPATATNELGQDNQHTVTATVSGAAGHLAGWPVAFAVAGQNAGATGVCAPLSCETDSDGVVTFSYSVPAAPSSLGTDSIHATVNINGVTGSRQVDKLWQDTTPPVATCVPGPNPHGQIPSAPGQGGQGQNQDGYYTLSATDDIWPAASLEIYVNDDGSSHVFGPFADPTNIKYTQAKGAQPGQKPGSGAVGYYLNGKGDALVYAVDGAGNESNGVACLVPPAPK